MVTKESIDAALSAHSLWKKRLQDAIAKGSSEFKPQAVSTDNACEFGKWLYSLPASDTQSSDYQTVKTLHANFHRITGGILQLAVSGKEQEAIAKLGSGGEYSSATGKLVLALQAWKDKL